MSDALAFLLIFCIVIGVCLVLPVMVIYYLLVDLGMNTHLAAGLSVILCLLLGLIFKAHQTTPSKSD